MFDEHEGSAMSGEELHVSAGSQSADEEMFFG